MRPLILAAMVLVCVSCESPVENDHPWCVTLQCDGDNTGWTSCYYACGACIEIDRAQLTTTRAVCSF